MLNPNDIEEHSARPLSSSIFSPLSPAKMSMRKTKKIGNLLRPGTAASTFYQQVLNQPQTADQTLLGNSSSNNNIQTNGKGTFLAPQDENLIEINSDLPLAILIYFHSFYSTTWLLVTLIFHILKHNYNTISTTDTAIFSVVIVVWTVIEFPRLLIGYSGNLKEKVPRVFAFMILSTIQPLLYIYFIAYQPVVSQLDYIICSIQLLFYFLEYIFGISSLRNFTRVSGIRYKLYFNKDGTLALDEEEDVENNNKNLVEPFINTEVVDFSDNSEN